MKWYLKVLKQYADFNGRARRKEFWMFVLFNVIISLFLQIISRSSSVLMVVGWLYSLFILVPYIAVSVRRLHDVGKSGWWLILPCVVMFVTALFFVFGILSSYSFEGLGTISIVFSVVLGIGVLLSSIWLLIQYFTDSQHGENKYGKYPKEEQQIV